MKTMLRLVRRYILAAILMTSLLVCGILAVFLAFVYTFGVRYQKKYQPNGETSDEIAAGFSLAAGGWTDGGTAAEHLQGYEWAMLLDDDGNVLWRYRLPAQFDHRYTVSEVASFSRWYLDGYPVMTYLVDDGLFVMARPVNSVWRYNWYTDMELLYRIRAGALPFLLGMLGVVLLFGLLYSWRTARALGVLGQGIDALAQNNPVPLPESGFTGELAGKLNRTGERLRRQSEIIARRDSARTDWIAGVSHDIRTPLSLILGYAEQIQSDPALPEAQRRRAGAIQTQSLRIRELIEDLNLTSKLQYNAQPLRRAPVEAGPLLRAAVAEFCDGAAGACTVDFGLTPDAGRAVLNADAAMLRRAFANLLGNSARHNPGGCAVAIRGELLDTADGGRCLELTFSDDGAGYPPAVLAILNGAKVSGAQPHILGLHLVEQIVKAHGGSVLFTQNAPHGAKATLYLPCSESSEGARP